MCEGIVTISKWHGIDNLHRYKGCKDCEMPVDGNEGHFDYYQKVENVYSTGLFWNSIDYSHILYTIACRENIKKYNMRR